MTNQKPDDSVKLKKAQALAANDLEQKLKAAIESSIPLKEKKFRNLVFATLLLPCKLKLDDLSVNSNTLIQNPLKQGMEEMMRVLSKNPQFKSPKYSNFLLLTINTLIVSIFNSDKISDASKISIAHKSTYHVKDLEFSKTSPFLKEQQKINAITSTTSKYLETQIERFGSEKLKSNLIFWPLGTEKLKHFETSLKSNALIEPTSSLLPVFSNEIFFDNKQKVKWKGEQGALIYLIYLLSKNESCLAGMSIYKFTSERFSIKGKDVDSKRLTSSLYNVVTRYIAHSNKFPKPESLLQIDNIYGSISPKN